MTVSPLFKRRPSRGQQRQLSDEELRLFDLVFAGSTDAMSHLRQQYRPPFCEGVARVAHDEGYVFWVTHTNETLARFSIPDFSPDVADLTVSIDGVGTVRTIGEVVRGAVTSLRLELGTRVDWPAEVAVSDFGYLAPDEEFDGHVPSSTQRMLEPSLPERDEPVETPAWLTASSALTARRPGAQRS